LKKKKKKKGLSFPKIAPVIAPAEREKRGGKGGARKEKGKGKGKTTCAKLERYVIISRHALWGGERGEKRKGCWEEKKRRQDQIERWMLLVASDQGKKEKREVKKKKDLHLFCELLASSRFRQGGREETKKKKRKGVGTECRAASALQLIAIKMPEERKEKSPGRKKGGKEKRRVSDSDILLSLLPPGGYAFRH